MTTNNKHKQIMQQNKKNTKSVLKINADF